MPNLTKEEMVAAVKEGIKEWLDDQFRDLGRWSFYGLASLILAGMAFYAFRGFGWHRG